MKIAILGTGDVGRGLADRLLTKGHEVRLGSRTADNPRATEWLKGAQGAASIDTFAGAADGAQLVMICVAGAHALSVAQGIAGVVQGTIVLDLSNPLDFSEGFPPRMSVCNDDSLGEQIQRALPGARVVKALNTLAGPLMLDPGRLSGPHDVLLCGDDAEAKATVTELLASFGWDTPIDLGDISNARGLEMWLPLWTRLYRALGTGDFNLHIQRGDGA